MCWFTCLCNITWTMGEVPLDWQIGGWWFPFLRRGTGGGVSFGESRTSTSLVRSIEWRLRRSWISDSGRAVLFLSWPWDSGPSLHPRQGTRWWSECMGVRPTSLHVLCGLGESIWPCTLEHLVEGAPGVWSISHSNTDSSIPVWPVSEFGSVSLQ